MANQNVSLVIGAVDQATRTIQGITGNLDALRSKFGSLAGALSLGGSVAWLANLTKQSIEALDDLDELAQGLGLAATQLSAYQLSAKAAGVDSEQFTVGITKLNKKVSEAVGGNKEAVALFQAMGVEIKDASGKLRPMEQLLGDVADRFSTYADGAQKSALAMELFGKTGAKFIAFLNEGKEGLDKFGGASQEEIENAKKLSAEIDKLSASWEKLKLRAGGTVAGWINGKEADPPYVVLQKTNAEIAKLEAQNRAMGDAEGVDELNAALLIMLERARDINAQLSAEGLKRFMSGSFAAKFGDRVPPNPEAIAAEIRAREKAAAEAETRAKATAAAEGSIYAVEQEVASIEKLTAAQRLMLSLGEKIAAGQLNWTREETLAVAIRLQTADATERLNGVLKDFEDERKRSTDAMVKSVAAQADLNKKQAEETELIGKTKGEIFLITQQRLEDTIAKKEATLAAMAGNGEDERQIALLRSEIQLLKERRGLNAGQRRAEVADEFATAQREAAEQLERDAKERRKRTEDDISRGLTDALMRGFEGGKDAGQNFLDALRNMFKTQVIKIFIEPVINAASSALTNWLMKGLDFLLFSGASFGGGDTSGIDWTGGVDGRAAGGPVVAGQPYLVGEAGPELIIPGQNSFVMPNNAIGGVSVTQNIQIDSRTDRASIAQLLEASRMQTINDILEMRMRNAPRFA